MRIEITRSQKKIIVITFLIVLVFFIAWLFVYLPNRNNVAKIKSELVRVDVQIQEIEAAFSKAQALNKDTGLLYARIQELENKFPKKEEESLKMLSEFAQKFNFGLTSIKTAPKRALLDENGKETKIEGKTCYAIYVSLTMKCFYAELVEYIKIIEEEFPAFVTIKTLHVVKDTPDKAKELDIALDLDLYLLS